MPDWAHLLSTLAALGLALGWLAWRWLHPGRSATCSSCSAGTLTPPGATRARRSAQLKILG